MMIGDPIFLIQGLPVHGGGVVGGPEGSVQLDVPLGDNQRCYDDVVRRITREAYISTEVIVIFLL